MLSYLIVLFTSNNWKKSSFNVIIKVLSQCDHIKRLSPLFMKCQSSIWVTEKWLLSKTYYTTSFLPCDINQALKFMCVLVRQRECAYVCVCVRERERVRVKVRVCACVKKRSHLSNVALFAFYNNNNNNNKISPSLLYFLPLSLTHSFPLSFSLPTRTFFKKSRR